MTRNRMSIKNLFILFASLSFYKPHIATQYAVIDQMYNICILLSFGVIMVIWLIKNNKSTFILAPLLYYATLVFITVIKGGDSAGIAGDASKTIGLCLLLDIEKKIQELCTEHG